MDFSIFSILMLDGITNGAVYGLLGLATVLVFTVTRVIFIAQGEFVAYGALTLAVFQTGKVPGTVWLLLIAAILAAVMEFTNRFQQGENIKSALTASIRLLIFPFLISLLSLWAAPLHLPLAVQSILTVAIVSAFGPLLYRIAYQSLESESSLVLLIVSVGVHFGMSGLGLLFFGAEGYRNPSFWDLNLVLGPVNLNGQTIIIFCTALTLIVMLWLFFERTLYGKALRATAVNRNGARLMGISTHTSGQLTFTMAAMIGSISGLLIGPSTTVFYDSGFLIGLKGFVAAVIAGLASYPIAMIGALGVGIVESFGSFWTSAFKEVIVFTLVLPVLLWLSLKNRHLDGEN